MIIAFVWFKAFKIQYRKTQFIKLVVIIKPLTSVS